MRRHSHRYWTLCWLRKVCLSRSCQEDTCIYSMDKRDTYLWGPSSWRSRRENMCARGALGKNSSEDVEQWPCVEWTCFMFKEAQEVKCSESVREGRQEVFGRRRRERSSALEIEKSWENSKGITFLECNRNPRFTWLAGEQQNLTKPSTLRNILSLSETQAQEEERQQPSDKLQRRRYGPLISTSRRGKGRMRESGSESSDMSA